jgi:NAD(P)-dependent dehydrogenase (short-subunit alcohol dehydrogenase family)
MSIALLTGANRGLGFAAARALAREGACVLLAGRDQAKAEHAAATRGMKDWMFNRSSST